MKKKNKRKKIDKKKKSTAFTLIELLAVIIILGVIMLIAIPGVTRYITDSRKDAYVTTVKRYVDGAKTLVNDPINGFYDTDTTYYIPLSCINMERGGGKTPYGDFSKAYVLVAFTGDGYNYFFTGTDTSKIGIKSAVSYDDLNKKNIEPNVEDEDIKLDIGIDGRSKVAILNDDCEGMQTGLDANSFIDNEGNEISIGEIPGHEYLNTSNGKYYGSLQEAINEATGGNVIKVMTNVEEKDTITIPNTLSSLKIDFNGYEIFYDWNVQRPLINNSTLILLNSNFDEENYGFSFNMWSPILNNGTVEVNEGVEFRSENDAIENYGVVNVKGGHVFGYDADGIDNYGVVNVTGGDVNGYSTGIRNNGTVNINAGKISGYNGVGNCGTCTVNLSGTGVITGSTTGLGNSGTVVGNGGTIGCTGWYGCTALSNGGNVTLTNTTIEGSASGYNGTYGIQNDANGNVTINFANITVNGKASTGIVNNGYILINDINLIARTSEYPPLNAYGLRLNANSNTIIKNGKIDSLYQAIVVNGNYTLTLGTNDGNISTSSPELYGSGRSGMGIYLGNSGSEGTINFYDGIIKYANGVTYCLWGNATPTINYPTGYTLFKEYNAPLGTGYLVRQ